jgi:hypothetical protein
MPQQKKPRTFDLHWGSGIIAEEVRFEGEHHVPAIQLLEFTQGETAGALSIRFCYYDHRGRFQRGPLILSDSEIDGLRRALEAAPRLKALLRELSA